MSILTNKKVQAGLTAVNGKVDDGDLNGPDFFSEVFKTNSPNHLSVYAGELTPKVHNQSKNSANADEELNKLRTILTSINPETVSLENKQDDLNANGFTIFAGQVNPKIYLGPSTQAEDSSEASSEYVSNEAKALSKSIKGDIVGGVEAPDFFQGIDNLMKKVDEVVGDPNTPDTPMAEAFRNANKNRNRNRNRGHGRGHHD